jgi:hypothetical protein
MTGTARAGERQEVPGGEAADCVRVAGSRPDLRKLEEIIIDVEGERSGMTERRDPSDPLP